MSFSISRANPLRFVIKSPANLVGAGNDGILYSDQFHFGRYEMDSYTQPMAKDTAIQFSTAYSTNNISIRKLNDPDTIVQSLSKVEFPSDYLTFEISPSSLEQGERYFVQIDSFEGGQPDIKSISEPFMVAVDDKRILTIEYYNYDSAFGIVYNLPIKFFAIGIEGYFAEEVPIGDRTGFIDDNGQISTLSSISHRGVRLFTGFIPGYLHEQIKLALNHDYVRINGVVCQPAEPYEWEFDEGSSLAQGSTIMQIVEDAMINRHASIADFSFPAPPSNFSFTASGDPLNVNASWIDNSDDETSFELQYQINGGEWNFWESKAADSETHNENIIAHNPGDTLRLRIRSKNATGSSDWIYSQGPSYVLSGKAFTLGGKKFTLKGT